MRLKLSNNWLTDAPKPPLLWLPTIRLIIASFVGGLLWFEDTLGYRTPESLVLSHTVAAYLGYSIIQYFISLYIKPTKAIHPPIQISGDIVFIILLIHASGGADSGFGFLLILIIVIGSLISNGRYALFYAALATIGLLLNHSIGVLLQSYPLTTYSQPVLLSIACFATAWLAHDLGKRMHYNQTLVSKQLLDLAHLEEVNALISQASPNGIVIIDASLTLVHCNQTAMQYLSLPTSFSETSFSLQDIPALYSAFIDWQRTTNNQHLFDYHAYSLKVQFIPMNANEYNKGQTIIFLQDISQQKLQSQQAKLMALGTLTAKIAHEIRNPLSSISHANQLLQEDIILKDQQRLLAIIEDNIERIDQIIKDVLELNRRDRTKTKLISVQQFILDFHHQFCAVESVPLSSFVTHLESKDYIIQFDHRHLTQILWNLCKNGWEHSLKTQNSLQLSLRSDVINTIKLTILDDGEGIPMEEQKRIFEPFFTTKDSGSGLGLYISRELAEANGGLLTHKTTPNGTAFVLEIKLTEQ